MTDAAEWSGAVGDVWADEWRRTDRAFAELSGRLDAAILSVAPAGPFHAFDIGCGAGGTSLALAAARPDADVLGGDISSSLIAMARERAAAVAGHAAFETGDAIALATANGPFDLLYSRHGVMFFADPARAFAAFHAAARPGGRLVFSCFGDPAVTAFAGPLARALGLPAPQMGDAPGPFAFADPAYVTRLLGDAGWRDVGAEPFAFAYRVGGGDAPLDDAVQYLSRIGPAASALRKADPARQDAIRARLRTFLIDYASDSAVDLPAAAWLWSTRA